MCTLDSGVRAFSGSFKQKEEGSVFGDALCAEKSRGKGCVQPFSNCCVLDMQQITSECSIIAKVRAGIQKYY